LNKWDFDRIQGFEKPPKDGLGRDIVVSGIEVLRLMEVYDKMWSAAALSHPKKYDGLVGEGARPIEDLVAYGSVPISRSSCKTFLLSKKDMRFEAWDSVGALVSQKLGPWPSPAKLEFPFPEVKNLEVFKSPFTENFYAFVCKEDYYFVTESGELYQAPQAKDGEKSRTVKALWNDAKRPIVAVIEDADHDKVWLFAKDKTAGAKRDLYFEMKSTIETESFDPAKLRPVDVQGRAKLLLEYLPLIRKD
jgi:hypothetical protein